MKSTTTNNLYSLITGPYTRAAVVVTSLLFQPACGDKEESTDRSKNYGTTPDGERGNPQQNPENNPTDSATTGSDPSLPSYLFSLADAQGISELVLPYVQSSTKDQTEAQDATQNANRDFIAGILDEMMNLKPHTPGRDFTVVVSADTAPNASALNQSLVINKGIISFAPSLSLAMVICHEVAHSTRNHSSQSEKFMTEYEIKKKSAAEKLDAELKTLVARVWNKDTQKFNHTTADYDKTKPIWDVFWGDFVIYLKKFESEADVVGGRICANSGFSTTEVEDGFNKLFDLFAGMSPQPMKEGIYPVKESELGKFLQSVYGSDPHPTDAERRVQISRVKTAFVPGESTAIADKWKAHFVDKPGANLVPDSRPAGLIHSQGVDIMARRTQNTLNH